VRNERSGLGNATDLDRLFIQCRNLLSPLIDGARHLEVLS
jgi:hypothetical protein